MNESAPKPRRPWHRWLTQFSLRSLLILVTLSAVACWWFLRPDTAEEPLVDKLLILRREVRTIKEDFGEAVQSVAGAPNPAGAPAFTYRTISDGSWRLYDEFGGLIARGQCVRDVREGRWTLYHPNGQKAAEGNVLHGARDGLWKVWNADGQPVSEVTYRAAGSVDPATLRVAPTVFSSGVPVVGATSISDSAILPQFGGAGSVPLSPGMAGFGQMPPPPPRPSWHPPLSLRHGPCRAWHSRPRESRPLAPQGPEARTDKPSPSTPTLASEGQYENDLRTGEWTFYDQQGREIERGTFVADLRDGQWTTRDPTTGKRATITYIAGRTRAEHEKILAGIRADLAADSIRRQVAAITRAEELGARAWPLLVELLDRDSSELKLLALRTFVRQASFPAEATPKIELLVDHPDERLAVRAMSAIYIAQPARRGQLYDNLLAAIQQDDPRGLAMETFQALYRADEDRRADLVQAVVKRLSPQIPAGDVASGWNNYGGSWIADLGSSVIPHLDTAFQSGNSHERLFVIKALRELVARGRLRPPLTDGTGYWFYEIPSSAQPLLDRALADPDPMVQEAAKGVGQVGGGFGGIGGGGAGFFGGQSGGFF